jgi:RNA polymerase sigma-70 factor (ECF subfamily)
MQTGVPGLARHRQGCSRLEKIWVSLPPTRQHRPVRILCLTLRTDRHECWNRIAVACVLGAGGTMTVSQQAFERHVLELLGPLHGVARRLTLNDADAEDLVAETVARAWKALDSLQSEAAFRAWLFRILNNTFITDVRRAGARPRAQSIHEPEADEQDDDFSLFEQMHQPFLLWFSNPEQEFLNKLLREDLDRALASLPEHYRVVVILSDLEECSYAEIAQMLDVPIGTVRSRLARARNTLQKILWQQASEHGITGARTSAPGHAERRTRQEAGTGLRAASDKNNGAK